jgi:hypothetical protein
MGRSNFIIGGSELACLNVGGFVFSLLHSLSDMIETSAAVSTAAFIGVFIS